MTAPKDSAELYAKILMMIAHVKMAASAITMIMTEQHLKAVHVHQNGQERFVKHHVLVKTAENV